MGEARLGGQAEDLQTIWEEGGHVISEFLSRLWLVRELVLDLPRQFRPFVDVDPRLLSFVPFPFLLLLDRFRVRDGVVYLSFT